MWQDFVFTSGALIFILALLPSIFSDDKPAFQTSVTTSIILFVFAATYVTLGLYASAVVICINAFMWIVLAVQKGRS